MHAHEIKPKLGVLDLSIIVISLVIGMGIFSTPSEVAAKAGSQEIYFLVWLVGAVVRLIGALTFAEIGSRLPHAGGFYKLFAICYTPVFAFMVNWITVISNAASTAAVAIMGSAYIAPLLFPQLDVSTATLLVTVSTVALLLVVNLLDIKVSATLLNGLMILKIGLILLIISCLFAHVSPEVSTKALHDPQAIAPWKAFLMCFIPVFFTFGGYQQTMNFGGDIANPSRTLPRAIFIGIATIMTLYLLVNFSYVQVLGMEHLSQTKTLAADMIGLWFGKTASVFLSLVMFFAVMAYVNVSILSNPRVYYAMAEDGVLPKIFGKVNPKTQVQEFGEVIFCTFILLTLFMMQSFDKILQYVMFFDSISLISAAAAIFVLRKREKTNSEKDSEGYRIPLYPYLPMIYVAVYGLVIFGVFLANKSAFGWGAVLFILGYPLFFIIRKLIAIF